MASRLFKNLIEDEAIDRIAAVEFDVTYPRVDGVTNRAMFKIHTRRMAQRDDEVELWMELLGEIPGVSVRYEAPATKKGLNKITIIVDEVRAEPVHIQQTAMEFAYASH